MDTFYNILPMYVNLTFFVDNIVISVFDCSTKYAEGATDVSTFVGRV